MDRAPAFATKQKVTKVTLELPNRTINVTLLKHQHLQDVKIRQAANMNESFNLTKSKPSARTSSRTPSLQASNIKQTSSRSRRTQFSVVVSLHDTGEAFRIPKCGFSMKIGELKSVLELVAGIPTDFQRLCYLDKGVLMDETSFRYNGIVPGSTLSLMIWPYNGWPELVKAAATGSVNMLKSVVFKPAPFCSSAPNGSWAASWLSHRLFSALFISVHRGHLSAVRFLLQNGADVKSQTPRGRAALHAAASRGQAGCMRELLTKGAELHLQDREGLTAIGVAKRLGQGRSVGLLFLWDWQERAKALQATPPLQESELFAHQRFDSCLKTWLCGPEAQLYIAVLQGKGCPRGPDVEERFRGAFSQGSSEHRPKRIPENLDDSKGPLTAIRTVQNVTL